MLTFKEGRICIDRGPDCSRLVKPATETELYHRIGHRIRRERSLATSADLYYAEENGTSQQLARAAVIYGKESARAKRLIARTLREPLAPPKPRAIPLERAA